MKKKLLQNLSLSINMHLSTMPQGNFFLPLTLNAILARNSHIRKDGRKERKERKERRNDGTPNPIKILWWTNFRNHTKSGKNLWTFYACIFTIWRWHSVGSYSLRWFCFAWVRCLLPVRLGNNGSFFHSPYLSVPILKIGFNLKHIGEIFGLFLIFFTSSWDRTKVLTIMDFLITC